MSVTPSFHGKIKQSFVNCLLPVIVPGFIALFATTVWPFPILPYFYACSLEDRWKDARTKRDLEKHLRFSSKHVIDPKSSLWGHDHKLARNERMVQYRILWTQPLDVIYDDKDAIHMIYTSYE